MKSVMVLAGLVVAGGMVSGCREVAGGDGKPLVVTTVTMVTDLAREIGGERVRVEGLMGPGVDPHTYKPGGPQDSTLLEQASAVFYSGLHLEGKMQESLEQLAKRRTGVFAVTDGIAKEELLQPQEDFEGHHDPHVWGDPGLWKQTVPVVVRGLSEIDPEGADYYEERGRTYVAELEALRKWVEGRIAEVPPAKRLLVTSHDAFFYFGKGFDFEVRGLQGVSTVSEAGLKDRAELVGYIRARGIRTIFPETSVNPKAIAAVAAEAGVVANSDHLFSDAMGTPGEVVTRGGVRYDMGTYLGMVRHNVNSIVEGLK